MEIQTDCLDLFKITEVELVYKGKGDYHRPVVQCAADAYEVLRNSWDVNKIELVEQFKVLLLDTNCEVLGISELSTGGIAGTVADPKLIFATALKARAASIIVAHNHPSGNLTPSSADIDLTRKLSEAGNFLDLKVRDHLILTRRSFYSMQNAGTWPTPF